MVTMKSFEYDLRYLSAGLEILEKYLLSDEVFWPIHIIPPEGEPAYPKLTLDGLLMAQARLMGHKMYPDRKDQADPIITNLEFDRSKWRVAWEKKAGQCYFVRERMWRGFLQEYQDSPQENVDRYRYEVRLRVMLELLKSEFRLKDFVNIDSLPGLDKYLKGILVLTGFIWEPDVQGAFPEEVFWFLYGVLPTGNR
jgi:hypothetical protein